MERKIVLGALFGDEGKGVTVQWLCRTAMKKGKSVAVVRFSGGPQAAHTIRRDGIEHICSTYGAGVLDDVPTFLFPNVYFDPISAKIEHDIIVKKTGKEPKLHVHSQCRRITPYDVMSDRTNRVVKGHGSCGKGIHATFVRHNNGCTIDEPWRVRQYYFDFWRCEGMDPSFVIDASEMDERYMECSDGDFYETFDSIDDVMKSYDVIVFEGSQGLLLDMDRGFFPHVTPSHTGLDGLKENGVDLNDAEIYLVSRTYVTRHGNGYEPKGDITSWIGKKYESNVLNEFQGRFKTGKFEPTLLSKAFDRHNLDTWITKYRMTLNIVFTHCDLILENKSIEMELGNDDRQSSVVCFCSDYTYLPNCIKKMIYFLSDEMQKNIWDIYMNFSPEGDFKKLTV